MAPPGRKLNARDEAGFTLVELLIVVLCIGILAAMAIPSFLNQRDKANDAAAKSEARTAQTAAETYFVNEVTYVGLSATELRSIESTLNGATISAASGTATTFTVSITSKSGNVFTLARQANGVVVRTCTTGGKGACAKNRSW